MDGTDDIDVGNGTNRESRIRFRGSIAILNYVGGYRRMSFDAFTRRIPPPTSINEPAGDWDSIFTQLGTQLPSDYRRFIDAYGTGYLARFYTVANPFSSNRYVNLFQRLDMIRRSEADSTFFPDAGYAFYPEDDGLIPFMLDDNGNDYFWRTMGEPDDWRLCNASTVALVLLSINCR